MSVMAKAKSAAALLALVAVAGIGYTVVGQSSSIDRKERAAPPPPARDRDNIYVKLVMVVDDDAKNVSPDNIDVWYYVNGKKYPPHGAFQTKRYWYRVLRVEPGTNLSVRAEGQTGGQRITVAIYYENRMPAIIDTGTCVGLCAAEAHGTVRA